MTARATPRATLAVARPLRLAGRLLPPILMFVVVTGLWEARVFHALLRVEEFSLARPSQILGAIVDQAIERKVGARGLRIILEELMLDVMYQVPSVPDIREIVISRDVVDRRVPPLTAVRKVS